MRLPEGIEWALHCTTVLAALPSDAALPAKRLAEFHGVAEPYLVKQLQALGRAGITKSVPGPKGGYRLARPPAQITVLEVVEAIDGAAPAFRCSEIRRRGPAALDDPAAYRAPCGIHAVMARADTAWRASLQAVTIADLVVHVAENVDPRGITKGLEWMQEALLERS